MKSLIEVVLAFHFLPFLLQKIPQKIPNKFTQFGRKKLTSIMKHKFPWHANHMGMWDLPTNPIFPSRTHRVLITLNM